MKKELGVCDRCDREVSSDQLVRVTLHTGRRGRPPVQELCPDCAAETDLAGDPSSSDVTSQTEPAPAAEPTRSASQKRNGNHDLPFAKELFEAADRMRGSVESAEYKHLVLGLLFLKYISDSFERRHASLEEATKDRENEDYFTEDDDQRAAILEDRDEYVSENVFWVPPEARFDSLLAAASRADIGEQIDRALDAIERDNPEHSAESCRRSTPERRSSPRSSAPSSGQSPRSASATTPTRRVTYLVAPMSTSSASSRGKRATEAASSTRRAQSRDCSSRCWSHSRVASSIRHVARAGSSSSQPSS
jgi:HsdM N-terminal domain